MALKLSSHDCAVYSYRGPRLDNAVKRKQKLKLLGI